ncbi:MAG: hypothetical protein KF851_06160 [Pirellulaceae bacterium]|nr:hypothetical protein [Pirellulaceae bacterium]
MNLTIAVSRISRGLLTVYLLIAAAFLPSSTVLGQKTGNAGLPLELKISTPKYVVKGPDVHQQIPTERGVFRISGPGILRITWIVKKDFDDFAPRGGFTLSWPGQRQATFPGRPIGQSSEPEKASAGKLQKFVWLCEIPADVADIQFDATLGAYWYPIMDQNPWAGIVIYPNQQAFLVDWLESSSVKNLSGRWSGSTSTGFGVDIILQEQDDNLTGTLGGNPITGKRNSDGTIEFVSTTPKQSYRGTFSPETGTIKGTFDCEVTPAKDVGWEATRTTFENNPILAGGNIELPTEPTHFPSGALIVQSGSRKVNAGENVLVPIEVLGGKGLGNLNVVIEYDSKVAQVSQKSKAGEILAGKLFESNPQDSGVFRFGFAGNEGLAGDGVLTMLPITAIGKPGEKSQLTVTVTAANDSDGQALESTVISGEIEIVSTGGAGSGDVNDDGLVNALDALAALRMSVKLIRENMAADMDQDGIVTSNDARLIMLKFVGR